MDVGDKGFHIGSDDNVIFEGDEEVVGGEVKSINMNHNAFGM